MIQERSFLSARLPPERLYVLDHGNLLSKYFRFGKINRQSVFPASLEAARKAKVRETRVQFAGKTRFFW